jgi:hypothetical protein
VNTSQRGVSWSAPSGLVGAGIEKASHVGASAHATTHRERDEHFARHRFHYRHDGVALVGGCGNVEEGELVGALVIVAAGDLHRIPRVTDGDEVDTLDHTPGVNVETRYDAFRETHGRRIPELVIRGCA